MAAGPCLQRECSRKGKVKEGGVFKVRPGRLNCRSVYFAVYSSWNNGQGEKVRLIFYGSENLVLCCCCFLGEEGAIGDNEYNLVVR